MDEKQIIGDGLLSQPPEAVANKKRHPLKLSIIIINYKTSDLTLQCLESIHEFRPQCRFEIVLVDNGSNGGFEETAISRFPDIRFIELGENTGFTKANNIGIFNSRGEYILLLNSDTKFIEPALDDMVNYLDRNSSCAAVGPALIDGEGRYQLSFGRLPSLKNEILRKIMNYHVSLDDTKVRDYLSELSSEPSGVDWISGACIMLRRSALEKTGLLDEAFFMYFEDVDLCARFRRAGWNINCLPSLRLVHFGGQSVKNDLLLGLVAYRRSQLHFARKYYGRAGDLAVRFFLLLKFGLIFTKWFPILALEKLLKLKSEKSFTMALFAKKVLQLVFKRDWIQPKEPLLSERIPVSVSPPLFPKN